jgi:aldehyde:ferredoxin oxidoreductase
MTEPLKGGASQGNYISKQDLEQMLNEYYAERGWDIETGMPTRGKLVELGLESVADELNAPRSAKR